MCLIFLVGTGCLKEGFPVVACGAQDISGCVALPVLAASGSKLEGRSRYMYIGAHVHRGRSPHEVLFFFKSTG